MNVKVDIRIVLLLSQTFNRICKIVKHCPFSHQIFILLWKYFFIKKGYLVSGEAVSHGTLPIPSLHTDMTQSGEDESFSRTSMMQEERKAVPFPWIH